MRESELCEATLTMDQLRGPKPPRTANMGGLDFDVFAELLSFYVRTINILVSQDLDANMEDLGLAGGTGKIATLLLVGANPGIRPSVLAHLVRRDRSADLPEGTARAGTLPSARGRGLAGPRARCGTRPGPGFLLDAGRGRTGDAPHAAAQGLRPPPRRRAGMRVAP